MGGADDGWPCPKQATSLPGAYTQDLTEALGGTEDDVVSVDVGVISVRMPLHVPTTCSSPEQRAPALGAAGHQLFEDVRDRHQRPAGHCHRGASRATRRICRADRILSHEISRLAASVAVTTTTVSAW